MRKVLLYLICLPADIFAWIAVLFLWLFWGTNLRFQNGNLAFELKQNSWPVRTWYKGWGGTCFGHALMYHPGGFYGTTAVDSDLEFHENYHVKQYEGYMLRSLVYGAVAFLAGCNAFVALGLWVLGAPFAVVSNGVVALLRGENFYRNSTHEEGTRGWTKVWLSTKLRKTQPPKKHDVSNN